MKARLPLLTAALLATVQCSQSSTRGFDEYLLTGSAQLFDSAAASTSTCSLTGYVPLDSFALPPWSASALIHLGRGVGAVARETTFTVSVDAKQDSTGYTLILGTPMNDTLTGPKVANGTTAAGGNWACLQVFPLGGDSLLQASGYRATPAPTGKWVMLPAPAIGLLRIDSSRQEKS